MNTLSPHPPLPSTCNCFSFYFPIIPINVVLGNVYSGMRQSHWAACKWTKYRVLFNTLSSISWLLSIAQIKQSTAVFAHHYYCTFSFMIDIWAEPVYTLMSENNISSQWDSNDWTAKDVPICMSWRMAHEVESWFLCPSDPISTVPLVIFVSSVSELIQRFGLPGTRHWNDRDRSRLSLAGKWSTPFLAGSIYF